MEDMNQLITDLEHARRMSKEWTEKASELSKRVIDEADRLKLPPTDAIAWRFGESMGSAKVVRPSTIKYDEDRLQATLGSDRWSRATKTVLDTKALDAMVADGVVEIGEVAACSEVVDRSPYVKITVKKS